MHKKLLVFVGLTIIVSITAGCIPHFIPAVKLSTSTSELKDPVIAVDPNGNSHVAGVVNDRIVYHRIDKLGNVERTEVIENPDPDFEYSAHKPDIAVTEDGTAWIVWYEETVTEKSAFFTWIPLSSDFDGLSFYLDGYEHTSGGFVRVVARANTVYAVYDRINTLTDHVGVIFYRRLMDPPGVVWSYDAFLEMGELYNMDLAIDSSLNLHVVYHDKHIGPDRHRLRYNSNATSLTDDTMNQMWEIGWSDAPITIAPKLSIHQFTAGVESVIMVGGVGGFRYVQYCEALGCDVSTRNFQIMPFTAPMVVTEYEILGYPAPLGYVVSFLGKDIGDIYPQVYGWVSTDADITQITDTETNKSNLSMVYGLRPVIGFIDYIVDSDPPLFIPFENTTVNVFDLENGLRPVFHTACPLFSDRRTLNMAASINLTDNTIPVAGVWNICKETWFSTNAFIRYLPLITR